MSEQEIIDVPAEISRAEIIVARDPVKVLAEAKLAAQALMSVVSQKKKPVIMNGEQYLEFEDWQTVARFYGLTVKVVSTQFLDYGGVKGFEAKADVLRADGQVVSSAEAMCLNDEEKWSTRPKYEFVNGKKEKVGEVAVPLFQLRSMAQTRACAKAFRNVLAWVVVLAGFKPTPAEEMTGDEQKPSSAKPDVAAPQAKEANGEAISEPQSKRLYAIRKGSKYPDDRFKMWLEANYGISDDRQIAKSDYEEICKHAQEYKA